MAHTVVLAEGRQGNEYERDCSVKRAGMMVSCAADEPRNELMFWIRRGDSSEVESSGNGDGK